MSEALADRLQRKDPEDVRRLQVACRRMYERGPKRITRRENPTGERISRKERDQLRQEASDRTFASIMTEWTNSGHEELKDFLESRKDSSLLPEHRQSESRVYGVKLEQMANSGGAMKSSDEAFAFVDWAAFLLPYLERLFDVLLSRCENRD